jgi:hypothetical protein
MIVGKTLAQKKVAGKPGEVEEPENPKKVEEPGEPKDVK